MRVLLFGATVVVFIRSLPKLQSLLPPSIVDRLMIMIGDALDSAAIRRAILENSCNAVINTAGNQVAPCKEQVLPKIVQAAVDAAVAAGKEREKSMRTWVIGGMNSLGYPGTTYLVDDYFPQSLTAHHRGTMNAIGSIPVSDLEWSLLIKAEGVPGWENSWLRSIPFIGEYLNLYYGISKHTTVYMDVADFMAADLESGDRTFVGKKVGIKQGQKGA